MPSLSVGLKIEDNLVIGRLVIIEGHLATLFQVRSLYTCRLADPKAVDGREDHQPHNSKIQWSNRCRADVPE